MLTVVTAAGIVAVILLAKTASQHRRHAGETALRLCPGCGNTNSDYARFCRRCGRAIAA